MLKAITQKGKSLEAIEEHLADLTDCSELNIRIQEMWHEIYPLRHGSLSGTAKTLMTNGRLFARPCPPSPQPGFIDSRVVYSMEELEGLAREITEKEPEGEIVLMEFSEAAEFSGIITPGSLTVGPGHDGATDGKDELQLVWYSKDCPVLTALSTASGVPEDKHPHCEVIGRRSIGGEFDIDLNIKARPSVSVVQVRAGDKTEGRAMNSVLKDIPEVSKVLVPTGKESFTEWRKIIKQQPPNTVVFHKGGSLNTHWGANSTELKIPYITTGHKPIVGDHVLMKNYKAPEFAMRIAPFIEGAAYALRTYGRANDIGSHLNNQKHHPSLTTVGEAMTIMLYGFHSHKNQRPEEGSRLLGLAVGYMVRLLGTACLGEWRHAKSKQHKINGVAVSKPARHSVYLKYWFDWHQSQAQMVPAMRSFRDETWSSSYGGPKWQRGARIQILMYDVLAEITNRLHRQGGYGGFIPGLNGSSKLDLISWLSIQLNTAVNLTHNGGWILNKFAEPILPNHASKGSYEFGLMCIPALEQHRLFIKYGLKDLKNSMDVRIAQACTSISFNAKKRTNFNKSVTPLLANNPLDKSEDDLQIGLVDKSFKDIDPISLLEADLTWEAAMDEQAKPDTPEIVDLDPLSSLSMFTEGAYGITGVSSGFKLADPLKAMVKHHPSLPVFLTQVCYRPTGNMNGYLHLQGALVFNNCSKFSSSTSDLPQLPGYIKADIPIVLGSEDDEDRSTSSGWIDKSDLGNWISNDDANPPHHQAPGLILQGNHPFDLFGANCKVGSFAQTNTPYVMVQPVGLTGSTGMLTEMQPAKTGYFHFNAVDLNEPMVVYNSGPTTGYGAPYAIVFKNAGCNNFSALSHPELSNAFTISIPNNLMIKHAPLFVKTYAKLFHYTEAGESDV